MVTPCHITHLQVNDPNQPHPTRSAHMQNSNKVWEMI